MSDNQYIKFNFPIFVKYVQLPHEKIVSFKKQIVLSKGDKYCETFKQNGHLTQKADSLRVINLSLPIRPFHSGGLSILIVRNDTISMELSNLYFKGVTGQNFYQMMYFCPRKIVLASPVPFAKISKML